MLTTQSQGRTLEELAWIYEQPNPVKASKHKDKIVVEDNGHVVEVDEDQKTA